LTKNRISAVVALGGLALLLVVAGLGYAVIPAGDGTLSGCYRKIGGALRIIDPAAGQSCASTETALRWKDGIHGKVADSNKLDGLDSSAFQRAGAAAGGDLQGSYPSPRISAPEPWHLVASNPATYGPGCQRCRVDPCLSGGETAIFCGSSSIWFNYGPQPWASAGFYKDRLGTVHLRGLIKQDISGGAPHELFILPAGYRPTDRLVRTAIGSDDQQHDYVIRVDVLPTGEVDVPHASPQGYLSLDGIAFATSE
jgi:hypothetical protein